MFFWWALEQKIEQTIETPVICDATVLIMTSLYMSMPLLQLQENWSPGHKHEYEALVYIVYRNYCHTELLIPEFKSSGLVWHCWISGEEPWQPVCGDQQVFGCFQLGLHQAVRTAHHRLHQVDHIIETTGITVRCDCTYNTLMQQQKISPSFMLTSWNGNVSPLFEGWGGSSLRWTPSHKANNAEILIFPLFLWCLIGQALEQTVKLTVIWNGVTFTGDLY